MPNSIKKIAIIGKDTDAWITALFLKSGLNSDTSPIEIELIELPSDLTPKDYYSVLPSFKNLHKILGANEASLAKSAKAQHFFGQKFINWNQHAGEFMHAYEKVGINFESIDFYQYWLKAKQTGLNVELHEFCLSATATRHPSLDLYRDLLTHKNPPNFGYHLSAQEYVSAVSRAAIAAGISHQKSTINRAHIENSKITKVTLADGTDIYADLFIDASGSSRLLINQLKTDNFDDWSSMLFCDRSLATRIQSFEPSPSFGLNTAFSNGWYGLNPLHGSTGVKVCYSSKYADREAVIKEVSNLLGVKLSDFVEREHQCGMLKQAWVGNCIAVGDAIATLDQSDALDLQPLLLSLIKLRSLFPNEIECALEATIYNRHLTAYLENLRDFQVAHYLLNDRPDEPFWDNCRNITPSNGLARKIRVFRETGRFAFGEFEAFQAENWTLMLNGHGVRPSRYHPLVDNIDEQDLIRQFSQLLKKIGEDAKALAPME